MDERTNRTAKSSQEWRDLFEQIGDQIRREAARAVGVGEDATWATIGQVADDKARHATAEASGADEDASWEEIGRRIERSTRSQIAQAVGVDGEATWDTIGQAVGSRLEGLFQDLFVARPKTEDEPEDSDEPFGLD